MFLTILTWFFLAIGMGTAVSFALSFWQLRKRKAELRALPDDAEDEAEKPIRKAIRGLENFITIQVLGGNVCVFFAVLLIAIRYFFTAEAISVIAMLNAVWATIAFYLVVLAVVSVVYYVFHRRLAAVHNQHNHQWEEVRESLDPHSDPLLIALTDKMEGLEACKNIIFVVVKAIGLSVWILILLAVTGELIAYCSTFIGYGWVFAIFFALFALPGSRPVMLRLGEILIQEIFFDNVSVWIEESVGVVHRVSDKGYGYFWARDADAREIVNKWIRRINGAVDQAIQEGKLSTWTPRPRRTFSFGWRVPPSMDNAVYEGVMHDEEKPQCVSNIGTLIGGLPVAVIDT